MEAKERQASAGGESKPPARTRREDFFSTPHGARLLLLIVLTLSGSTLMRSWWEEGGGDSQRTLWPSFTFAIDINQASATEWSLLPGIGPGLAERILEHRRHVGGFRTIDQLLDVPGIGLTRLEQMKPYLCSPLPSPPATESR